MDLKQFKPVHWVYNLLHYKSLRHNKIAFKKFDIRKPLIGSISSKDFYDKESKAWLDCGNSRDLTGSAEEFNNFPAWIQTKISYWSDNGFLILENFIEKGICDEINNEIERLVKNKLLKFNDSNKLMFAYKQSRLIKIITEKPELLAILKFILGKEVILFQTINFISGSEQRAHSDSIHMTTYPLGFLIACWLALEDTSSINGPLFYYPGSHKLPYLLNEDFNEGETKLKLGIKDYAEYEEKISEQIKTKGFSKTEFHAKKGDLLIWHGNLLHGGASIVDAGSTRKSMVMHYFAKDVVKYHEITQRPSLIRQK